MKISDLSYRFVVGGTPATLPAFERALFGPFTFILQQDIDREF
jgi:exportin-2 (importin alpha re-exporter)